MSDTTETVISSRSRLFSAGHFYRQDKFSDEENRRVFGACYSPYGHGHNYRLELAVEGPLDPRTLQPIPAEAFEDFLTTLTNLLDHRHLNFEIPEFRAVVPTTENIALYFHQKALEELERLRLQVGQPALRLKRLRLYETPELWVEVGG